MAEMALPASVPTAEAAAPADPSEPSFAVAITPVVAVIALNFTINSMYQVLSSGDNPVNRLLTLNYITLGVSLLVNVLMFRFGVVERWFGRYVQEQLYFFLIWAIPLLVLTMASAVVLVALV